MRTAIKANSSLSGSPTYGTLCGNRVSLSSTQSQSHGSRTGEYDSMSRLRYYIGWKYRCGGEGKISESYHALSYFRSSPNTPTSVQTISKEKLFHSVKCRRGLSDLSSSQDNQFFLAQDRISPNEAIFGEALTRVEEGRVGKYSFAHLIEFMRNCLEHIVVSACVWEAILERGAFLHGNKIVSEIEMVSQFNELASKLSEEELINLLRAISHLSFCHGSLFKVPQLLPPSAKGSPYSFSPHMSEHTVSPRHFIQDSTHMSAYEVKQLAVRKAGKDRSEKLATKETTLRDAAPRTSSNLPVPFVHLLFRSISLSVTKLGLDPGRTLKTEGTILLFADIVNLLPRTIYSGFIMSHLHKLFRQNILELIQKGQLLSTFRALRLSQPTGPKLRKRVQSDAHYAPQGSNVDSLDSSTSKGDPSFGGQKANTNFISSEELAKSSQTFSPSLCIETERTKSLQALIRLSHRIPWRLSPPEIARLPQILKEQRVIDRRLVQRLISMASSRPLSLFWDSREEPNQKNSDDIKSSHGPSSPMVLKRKGDYPDTRYLEAFLSSMDQYPLVEPFEAPLMSQVATSFANKMTTYSLYELLFVSVALSKFCSKTTISDQAAHIHKLQSESSLPDFHSALCVASRAVLKNVYEVSGKGPTEDMTNVKKSLEDFSPSTLIGLYEFLSAGVVLPVPPPAASSQFAWPTTHRGARHVQSKEFKIASQSVSPMNHPMSLEAGERKTLCNLYRCVSSVLTKGLNSRDESSTDEGSQTWFLSLRDVRKLMTATATAVGIELNTEMLQTLASYVGNQIKPIGSIAGKHDALDRLFHLTMKSRDYLNLSCEYVTSLDAYHLLNSMVGVTPSCLAVYWLPVVERAIQQCGEAKEDAFLRFRLEGLRLAFLKHYINEASLQALRTDELEAEWPELFQSQLFSVYQVALAPLPSIGDRGIVEAVTHYCESLVDGGNLPNVSTTALTQALPVLSRTIKENKPHSAKLTKIHDLIVQEAVESERFASFTDSDMSSLIDGNLCDSATFQKLLLRVAAQVEKSEASFFGLLEKRRSNASKTPDSSKLLGTSLLRPNTTFYTFDTREPVQTTPNHLLKMSTIALFIRKTVGRLRTLLAENGTATHEAESDGRLIESVQAYVRLCLMLEARIHNMGVLIAGLSRAEDILKHPHWQAIFKALHSDKIEKYFSASILKFSRVTREQAFSTYELPTSLAGQHNQLIPILWKLLGSRTPSSIADYSDISHEKVRTAVELVRTQSGGSTDCKDALKMVRPALNDAVYLDLLNHPAFVGFVSQELIGESLRCVPPQGGKNARNTVGNSRLTSNGATPLAEPLYSFGFDEVVPDNRRGELFAEKVVSMGNKEMNKVVKILSHVVHHVCRNSLSFGCSSLNELDEAVPADLDMERPIITAEVIEEDETVRGIGNAKGETVQKLRPDEEEVQDFDKLLSEDIMHNKKVHEFVTLHLSNNDAASIPVIREAEQSIEVADGTKKRLRELLHTALRALNDSGRKTYALQFLHQPVREAQRLTQGTVEHLIDVTFKGKKSSIAKGLLKKGTKVQNVPSKTGIENTFIEEQSREDGARRVQRKNIESPNHRACDAARKSYLQRWL